MSGGLYPYPHLHLSSLQIAVEVLCLSIAVLQSPFAGLACLHIDKCHLLNAWMIIHSDNDHVRFLLPNLPSSMLQSLSAPRWSTQCSEIRWTGCVSLGLWRVSAEANALYGARS